MCVHTFMYVQVQAFEIEKMDPAPKNILHISGTRFALQALQRAKDIDCYTIMGVVTYIYQVICK